MPRHNRYTNYKHVSRSTWHQTLKKLRTDLIVKPEQRNQKPSRNRE